MSVSIAETQSKLIRNLTLLKWLSVDDLFFSAAVVIAFELHVVGLSLAQMLLGESIFALTILLVDVPTSVFSDLINRKSAFIITAVCGFMSIFFLAFAQSFLWVVIAQILGGIAYATLSGTDSAMLYDTLKSLKREEEHRAIMGKIEGFFLVTLALGQVISGLIGAWNLRLAVTLCLLVPIMKLILIAFLEEPPRAAHPHAHEPFRHLFRTLGWFSSQGTLVLLVLASMMLALGGKFAFQTFNPYMELIHVPIVYWGFLWAGFSLLGAGIARRAHAIQKKLGTLGSFAAIFLVQIIGFTLMAKVYFIPFAALFPFAFSSVYSFKRIFFSDEINRRTESHRRATTLSIESFGAQFLQVCTLSFLGLYADRAGLPAAYLFLALVIAGVRIVTGMGLRRALKA